MSGWILPEGQVENATLHNFAFVYADLLQMNPMFVLVYDCANHIMLLR
jgi:hypothetical protein